MSDYSLQAYLERMSSMQLRIILLSPKIDIADVAAEMIKDILRRRAEEEVSGSTS